MQIYFSDQQELISDIRKKMILSVGFALLLFGFVLQKVLQKVLSEPFGQMVQAARQFTQGDENVRFNEQRNDEFGYLARFINTAIEALLSQQEEVIEALERETRSEMQLSLEKERAEVTLHSITDSVITVDMEERVQYINPAAELLLGIENKDVKRRPFKDLVNIIDDIENQPLNINPLHECFLSGSVIKLPEHSGIINSESNVVAIEASVAPMKTKNGDIIGAVMVMQDVSHTRRLTRQLSHQASHDMLTGLYNRRKFEQHLNEILDSVIREKRCHSLCYIDLDQFKIVNDTCGHIAGDELLQMIPSLFNKVLRSGDVVARLGGDEFGILLENCNIKQAEDIANKIRQQIKDFRFVWDDKTFEIGASIGVVEINETKVDLADIMSSADIACYAAKDAGRNKVHAYEPSDETVSMRYGEMHWTGRITHAIEEGRFRIYSQPIVSINGQENVHLEILLRMLDDDGRLIPPGAFLPAAERYSLMRKVDRWVINEVFRQKALGSFNRKEYGEDVVISINLSGESLGDETLLQYILEKKDKYDISLINICFEITETVAISNMNKAASFINELKNYGCQFSLDDFGSGLSSFSYLKTRPVSYLKIDGSFVKNITIDKVDKEMVKSIQQVGHIMNLKTIAEKVENQATLDLLMDIGVDFVQGFHTGRPEPVESNADEGVATS